MLASQVKSSVPKTEVLKKATLLNVNIPVIQLISSYSLVPEEELPSTDAAIGNTIPLPRSLTSIVATLDGVCVKGQVASAVGPPRPKLFTSCESASITLDAHGHGPGGHARSASCMVSARTWIKLADGSVSLVFAPTVTRIEHSAPRLLALCIDSLTCSIEGTYTTYYRNVKESSLSDQQLIRRVLFSSRDKVIIDPLSTIQPSYLVQTGRPRQLRLDPTFRFLIYLRNCLRYMGADERLTLTGLGEETPPKFAIEDLVRLMENDIIQGDVDPSYRDSAILGLVFPDINPLSHPKDHPEEFPLEAVHLLLEDFRVILHHPGNHFQSEVDVGRFEVTLHQRSTDWAKIASPISKRSFATLSSRVDAPHLVVQIVGSVSIGDVSFTVYPHLMQFAQAVIRARRSHCFLPRPPQQKSPSATKKPSLYYVDFALTTKSFQFKAAAERLIIEYRTTGVSYASTSLLRRGPTGPSTWESSMTHSLAFSEIRLQACGVPDMSNTEEYSVLAALVLTGGRGNLIVNQEAQPTSVIRAIFGLKSLHLNVPRSAMRLYRFGEEWKADYLAAIDSEIHELLSELNQSRPKPQSLSSRTSNKSVNWNYQIHASLNRCRISLQVMHGTWLSWEISDNITYLTSHPGRRTVRAFGLRIGSQTFGISSHTSPLGTPSHMSVRFHLPAFSANGYHDGKQIHALALVEFFHLTVKPSHWDTLLTVQQKFGQDFNDFFKLIEETRLKSERLTNPEARAEVPRTPYGVSIKMKGFRVGLEGLTSTLFLECEDVNGGISSDAGFSWRLNLLDLALSLAPQVNLHTRTSPFDPDRRSAFVIIDFQINMMTQTIFKLPEKRLQIAVSKTHAVMQPSSVGELGDFIDHLQV